jgi:uncharacterized membrane protein
MRLAALCGTVLLYSLYPVAVCVAIAAGRPRLALAATCIALGISCETMPGWRRLGIVLLVAAPFIALSAAADLAQPLVFLPPVALNLGLAALFARTLKSGHEPLISTFARVERGTLEPDLARYTRRLAALWVAFFVGAAAVSALLAFLATPVIWGWFVAVGNHVAVALLFMGEYLFRRWRFAQYRHASPLALAAIVVARWRQARNSR